MTYYNVFSPSYLLLGVINKNRVVRGWSGEGEGRQVNALQYALDQAHRLGTVRVLDKKLRIYPNGKSKEKHRVTLYDLIGGARVQGT